MDIDEVDPMPVGLIDRMLNAVHTETELRADADRAAEAIMSGGSVIYNVGIEGSVELRGGRAYVSRNTINGDPDNLRRMLDHRPQQ